MQAVVCCHAAYRARCVVCPAGSVRPPGERRATQDSVAGNYRGCPVLTAAGFLPTPFPRCSGRPGPPDEWRAAQDCGQRVQAQLHHHLPQPAAPEGEPNIQPTAPPTPTNWVDVEQRCCFLVARSLRHHLPGLSCARRWVVPELKWCVAHQGCSKRHCTNAVPRPAAPRGVWLASSRQTRRHLCGAAAALTGPINVVSICQPQVGVIYGNPEVTSGGQALKYYASVRWGIDSV